MAESAGQATRSRRVQEDPRPRTSHGRCGECGRLCIEMEPDVWMCKNALCTALDKPIHLPRR